MLQEMFPLFYVFDLFIIRLNYISTINAEWICWQAKLPLSFYWPYIFSASPQVVCQTTYENEQNSLNLTLDERRKTGMKNLIP